MTRFVYQFHCILILLFSVRIFSFLMRIDPIHFSPLQTGLILFAPVSAIIFCLVGLRLQDFWQRVCLCVSFILTMLCYFSHFGKIDHYFHIWIFSSLFICFLDMKQLIHAPRNYFVLRLIQITLLSQYFNAGLWKLRLAFDSASQDEFLIRPLNHLAYSVAAGNGPARLFQGFIFDPSLLPFMQIGFGAVVLFQLSSVVPVLINKHWKLWGCFAIAFHLATGLMMGIWFEETLIAAAFFLILCESLLNENSVPTTILLAQGPTRNWGNSPKQARQEVLRIH